MNSFEAYFSGKNIISILCKIRVSNANKRHKKHFYRDISSKVPNPHFKLPGDEFFPPRKEWKRPHLKERRGKSTSRINLIALNKTIKIKSGIAQDEEWYKKLTAFIKRVQSLALQNEEYKISKPCIHPIEKDKDKKTYRLISEYKVLEDKVIIGLTAKYFRDIFDEDFLDCSYAFRGQRESSQKIPTHHTAVQNLIDYLKNHEGKLLYVAECDIQKFFDVIHHKTARNSLDRAIKRANDRGIDVDRRAVLIFNSYLESYTFKTAKEEGNKWLEEKDIKGKIEWAQEGLQKFYDSLNNKPIGVPLRYDGIIRVRKKSIKKELSKQVQVVDEVIQALKKEEKVSKSKKQILFKVTGKLTQMSVGKILDSKKQCPPFCWASGFKLLREHDHITSQLKQLDRNRERQISRLKRKLKDYDLEPKAKTKEMKPKPPKYHGAPFSYYASCQVERSIHKQPDEE